MYETVVFHVLCERGQILNSKKAKDIKKKEIHLILFERFEILFEERIKLIYEKFNDFRFYPVFLGLADHDDEYINFIWGGNINNVIH